MEMEIINAVGKPCPIPVIEAKKALRKAIPGQVVHVLVDNDIARQNLQKMAEGMGCSFEYGPAADNNILVTIAAHDQPQQAPEGTGLVVALGHAAMGTGDDALGVLLMKSFLHSLTELDTTPETLLFFNGGVFLTSKGSAAIQDLKVLEEKGAVISSCGTCLDFYGITEKLAIGSVTNMYAIASAMAQARRVINL